MAASLFGRVAGIAGFVPVARTVQCLVVAAAGGCVSGGADRSETAKAQGRSAIASSAEQQWNRLDLLGPLAPIGDAQSAWDDLASARSFGLLQRALEEMRQLVLEAGGSEQEAAEGLRMRLKVLAMAADDIDFVPRAARASGDAARARVA